MRHAVSFIVAFMLTLGAALVFIGTIIADNPPRPVQSCELGWTGQLKPGPCADYALPNHHKTGR